MNNKKKFAALSVFVLISLLSSLVYTTTAFADDATPPPVESSEAAPTEEPIATEEPAATEAPAATEEAVSTEEPAATEAPAATEEPAAEEEVIAEVVAAAAEADVTLADADGEPLELGTEEAAETLAVGDPWFTTGGGTTTYRFFPDDGDCDAYPGEEGITCFDNTSTPIQDAIDFIYNGGSPLTIDDDTLHVEGNHTYNEYITINVEDLVLYGEPGNLTLAGAASDAPVLDGGGSGNGVTVAAAGVSLIGFVLQNYQNAIYMAVQGNDFTAENNTIQDNEVGILNANSVPGMEVHYNIFRDNGYAIKNLGGNPGDGTQFINAQNNFWGCVAGPLVYRDNGEYYQYEAISANDIGDPLLVIDPDCEVLFGDKDNHWNNNQSNQWSPYKIILDPVATEPECPPGTEWNPDTETCEVPPACGDGSVNQTIEQCDDGNTTSGDGCSASCEIEGCTDPLAPNYNSQATVDDGSCAAYCGDGNVDDGEACDDGNTTGGDGCTAACEIEGCTDRLAPNFDPNATVDDGSCAAYCGDGNVDDGEACDDGNQASGDGCTASCEIEGCTDPLAPNYDQDATVDDGSCAAYCGDGNVDDGEDCDDGNTVNGDGCETTCTVSPSCGDGNLDELEACDDGNNTGGDGCSAGCAVEGCMDPAASNYNQDATVDTDNCTYVCGNGVQNPGEACDDGNSVNDDACSNECVANFCGDGIVNNGEACDGGANCTDNCTLIPDPFCGDGTVDPGEECDGGANCTDNCTIIPPPPGTPPPPPPTGGGFIPVTGGTYALTAGIAHTCAITPKDGLQCWGDNTFGQLGDGTNEESNTPVDVLGLESGSILDAGGNHTCLLTGGAVWCWGANDQGQLGDGSTTNRNTPVLAMNGAVDISLGFDYSCATLASGEVKCWGNNGAGQLADGTNEDQTQPTTASLLSGLAGIDAGYTKDCGLASGGLISCLLNGATQEIGGFVPVTGASPEPNKDVSVNRFGSLVIALNQNGTPVEFRAGNATLVDEVSGAVEADSGLTHVCALLGTGAVKCWGSNYYGQLGNNSTKASAEPTSVVDLNSAIELAVGRSHTCAIVPIGLGTVEEVTCWGLNADGQLGNAGNTNSLVPVRVVGE